LEVLEARTACWGVRDGEPAVIEEQEVDTAKGLAKGIHLFAPDAVDQFINELFCGHIDHP